MFMMDESVEQWLTVAQAASLMRVSENGVYAWLKDGRVEHEIRDGVKMIAMPPLRRAKVLRQVDVLERLQRDRVAEKDIAEAIAQGAAHPSGAPDCRFSLEDCDGILALKNGTWKAPPQAVATTIKPIEPTIKKVFPTERDEFLVRAGRWNALCDYLAKHKDPARLPPTFWDTRDCPEFIPPAGVFRFTFWHEGVVYPEEKSFEPRKYFTWIRRSEGYVVRDGKLFTAPEDEEYETVWDFGAHGAEAPEFALQNAQYRQLRMAWDDAWHVRRRQLRRNGDDPLELPSAAPTTRRNRSEVLEKYHREGWGPADLPDWFWDTLECPPFEPPNGISRCEYGKQGRDPLTGKVVTYVRRTAVWNWAMFNELHFEPGTEEDNMVYGVHERGAVPLDLEHLNRAYDASEHEWREEWHRRARRRRGE